MMHESEIQEEEQAQFYARVNGHRWEMARWLLEHSPHLVLLPLYPYFYEDKAKAAKVPMIPWGNRTQTTARDIQDWQGKHGGFANLGLVLGIKSGGIVGIDADGAGGLEILRKMSGGDLPATVSYTTPNDGMRLLYMLPEEYRGTEFKKYVQSGEGEHCGLEILTDGQQTVLPWSIGSNGKIYRFIKGRSFKAIEIAIAPRWLMDKLLTVRRSPKPIFKQTPQNDAAVPLKKVISAFECRKLEELVEAQRSPDSLDENTWFYVIAFLTSTGYSEAAWEFSKLSGKHNERSEKRLISLAQQESKGAIRCVTFGCSHDDVANCFAKLHYNDKGELTNSPIKKLSSQAMVAEGHQGVADYSEIGININEEGNFSSLNFLKFARHFLETVSLRIFDGRRPEDCRYYIYRENYWNEMSELDLLRSIGDLLNRYFPDAWKTHYRGHFIQALPLECRTVAEAQSAKGYINCINGLVNLSSLNLEPHDRNIFCTTQIPVLYDENAECATFLAFMDDVFSKDAESIALMQEIFGYVLSPSTAAQKFFV